MLRITNTRITIDKDFYDKYTDYVTTITNYLTYKSEDQKMTPMYHYDDSLLSIPIGYLEFLGIDLNSPDVSDERGVPWIPSIPTTLESKQYIKYMLPGIELRDDQVDIISSALSFKSGIYQVATGAGKTEIICSILKYYHALGFYPNTIILEPTVNLVTQTIDRLAKYGIEAKEYKYNRVVEGIMVTHPASLNNDIAKHPEHLSELNCLICDEGHHLSANSWRVIVDRASKLEVRLAFSASIIELSKITGPQLDLSILDYEENMIVGVVGSLRVNYPPSYYTKRGILATPVVFRLYNRADEEVKRGKGRRRFTRFGMDYHDVRKCVLNAENRIYLGAFASAKLIEYGKRILILVDTKEQSEKIMKAFAKFGVVDKCRTIYGGQVFHRYDHDTDKLVVDNADNFEKLTSGEINVLVGTSVMYEGADLKLLDVVMLYSVGVDQRVFIQTIGRVLRKGKTGKYAYIIDFTDTENNVLKKQSNLRRTRYESVIGVNPNLIFDNLSAQQMIFTYRSLEGIIK